MPESEEEGYGQVVSHRQHISIIMMMMMMMMMDPMDRCVFVANESCLFGRVASRLEPKWLRSWCVVYVFAIVNVYVCFIWL